MTSVLSFQGRRRVRGMSLIELMVALVISSIVVLGLVTLINAIGIANRSQDGLARLQENGRYAMQRIASDFRLAGAQHCSKDSSFDAPIARPGMSLYMDLPRMSRSYFNASLTAGNGPGIGPPPTAPQYDISPRFMFMGHECDTANCTPALNAANRGVNRLGLVIPAMGTAVGARALGADVVTLRHFTTQGVIVERMRHVQQGPPDVEIELENDPVALAAEGFTGMAAGDPVWMSDCSTGLFLRGTRTGARTITMTGNFDNSTAVALQSLLPGSVGPGTDADARAFHLPTSLRTVSYYLQVKADPKQPGRLLTALMRKENDAPAQELVEGVERFDLLYGVRDSNGNVRFLTATQVDALGVAAAGDCVGIVEPGCGWRSVSSVEVYMLVNTVDDVSPTGDDEFRYSWLNTGARNVAGAFENPQALGVMRNGLPAGRVLRREFRTTVSLRTNNS